MYKLNKTAKIGIATGLAALIISGAVGCTNNNNISNPIIPNTTTSQSKTTSTTQITSDYISTLKSNEFKVYDENSETLSITLNNVNYLDFTNTLNSYDYSFRMEEYYGLDEALNLYNSTQINKSTDSNLLDLNGKLDKDKLIQQILINNKEYMNKGKDAINTFYSEASNSDITKICNIITKVVNSKFNDIEISKVANTLTKLTMFQRTGSASNAYITNNLTFVFNPTIINMYSDMQAIIDGEASKEETLEEVITHEAMHLLQYSVSDINDSNGLESGICRMYNLPTKEKKIPVDSLWNSWILEASAELGMSDYLSIQPGTYAKKISYAKSYNLSRFHELDLENNGIEDVTFNSTLEQAFEDLNLTTQAEQREFLNFMYSVEITQTDPDDVWENYTAKTGITPTDTEKTEIRMGIRTDVVKYLTRNFYNNLADAINEGKVSDLDTAFYLIRNWELDTYGHLEYTKTNALKHAEEFILWHGTIQSELFKTIAESNGKTQDEIESLYDEYNLQTNIADTISNNCNLNKYSNYTANYILDAKNSYTTSNFSRNSDVLAYINNQLQDSTDTTKTNKTK